MYVGPFKVLGLIGKVAYKLDLPEELSRVHNTFHVSNLKKCHADKPLAVPLDGLHFDDKLYFVKEPMEIVDHEVKQLKRSRIPLVKVQWNSKRGPEFTWELEDQFRKKYPHLFAKTTSSSSATLELTQETTEKIVQIKQRMQAAYDRQKSYADLKHKPMEFQVEDKVMLKVSPWKGVVRFGKWGKLNPRFHNTFHVSNLKKCHADEPLAVPLDGLHFDDKLHLVEEPVEIMDRKVKRFKQSQIPLVKVRWNSKRGPEFTGEREDKFRKKYPHLFARTAPSSSVTS
nr:putative reverse transcriptase domain-containing protein [Tanacetum cinerariifolium]